MQCSESGTVLRATSAEGGGVSLEIFSEFFGFDECLTVDEAQQLIKELQSAIQQELDA